MNLRTPRRRISPRTRRRYRAIREFFRRALGSSSQPDIKISSSIAVNVTDLKRKIVGLEQQLDEVNRHCQNITSLACSRRESETYLQPEGRYEKESNCHIPLEVKPVKEPVADQTEPSYERKLNGPETKLLYKYSNGQYAKSSNEQYVKSQLSESNSKTQHVDATLAQRMPNDYEEHVPKSKNKKSKLHRLSDYGAKLHKYRTRSVYESFASANSTSSFRSLINPRMHHSNPCYPDHPNDIKYLKQEYTEPIPPHFHKEKKYTDRPKRSKHDKYKEHYEQKPNNIRKQQKHQNRDLDQDFIADIIRRQYRPVKMFGRKESDLSQISAPICRDQEFSLREDIQVGTELCSCCYDGKHHRKHSDISEMRSICDTRLYSNKRHSRGKRCRARREIFNDSDVYDFIPVKEKSSPKTRRKFAKDNMLPYEYCREEVPPSPRTLRPRLNLKSQYNTEFDDYVAHVKHSLKGSPYRRRRQRERMPIESDVTSVQVPNFIEQPRKTHKRLTRQLEKQEHYQHDNGTISSLQKLPYGNDQVNVAVDTRLNKPEQVRGEQVPVDRTDKALCEIKDILQSFLQEIKKETAASQCDKSEMSSKTGDNGMLNDPATKLNDNVLPNSRHSINNFGVGYGASPFMSSFQNPCCYPVMPVCPMSYPNGYMMPSPSYTCANCVNVAKESTHNECHCCNKNTTTTNSPDIETCHTETENLIKEIYKFVAQRPVRKKDFESGIDRHEGRKPETKMLTSRSVGDSSRLTKHDANVGTPPLKCYSKSCEAIGSRMSSETYNSETNASYSDTILEKLSLQVTQSTSDTEIDTTTSLDKTKRNKFSNVLRSIGLLKKKRKDVIEELSESGSVIDVEVKPKSPRAPYGQEVTNYMMHGQEYYHPPPMTSIYRRPNEYQPDYNPPYNPGLLDYSQPPPPPHDMYEQQAHHSRARQQASAPPYPSKQRPTAPPFHTAYDNPYKQMQQPQVPLCLREIEVKSTGTQSERKMSIFRKMKKKIQPPDVEMNQNTCSTQTQAPSAKPPPLVAKPLFNWKKLQAKAMAEHDKRKMNPMEYSLKAGKELADGDLKLRNAMLKKLFYKRNPFSPRNLIVRTLLGKDKSSFGDAPTGRGFRPRMFL